MRTSAPQPLIRLFSLSLPCIRPTISLSSGFSDVKLDLLNGRKRGADEDHHVRAGGVPREWLRGPGDMRTRVGMLDSGC